MTEARGKEIGIGVLFGFLTLILFLLMRLLLTDVDVLSLGAAIGIAFISAMWIAAGVVGLTLSRGREGLTRAIVVIPAFAVIGAGLPSVFAVIGGLLVSGLMYGAAYVIHRELSERIHFQGVRCLDAGGKLITLGLLLALVSLAFPAVRAWAAEGRFQLSAASMETLLRPVAPVIRSYLPSYTESATIDQLIEYQLPGVPTGQKILVRADLAQRLGVQLSGQETLPRLVAQMLNERLVRFASGDGLLVSIVIVVVAIFALRTLVPIIAWPSILGAVLLLFLLRKVSFVVVEEVPASVQRLTL